MLIRAAALGDVPEMMKLSALSPLAPQWAEVEYVRLFSEQATPARNALVTEGQNKVCAFVIASSVDSHWELETIVVDASLRRQGIGGQLMGALLSHARQLGASEMTLEVRQSNAAARALYEQLGFGEQGRRKRYYHDPSEDAIIYSFSFSTA